jgi:uncharacterized delta-60 repeat protein
VRALAILVVALFMSGATAVARAAPGDLDTSFGGGTGKAIAGIQGQQVGNAVALEKNGRIVVAGSTTAAHSSADMGVAVFTNPGGVLDPSYGPNASGTSIGDLGAFESAESLALQPDGKIVVAGTRFIDSATDSHGEDLAVVRFTYPQGTADPSFGGGSGVGIGDLGGDDSVGGVALRPDGKIVVAGSSTARHDAADFAVAMFTDPGAMLDPAYGSGTGASIGDLGGSDFGNAVVLQPDGKIVVAGNRSRATPGGGTQNDLAVVRFNYPQGTADTSFGGGSGVGIGDLGASAHAAAVALQPNASNGKILVAGSRGATGDGDFMIARFRNPSGTLDPAFASGGRTTIDFGGNEDEANAMVVQPDGKIVVAGTTGNFKGKHKFALARLQPDGVLDTTFGTDGKVTLDLGGKFDDATGVALQADGKIVVAGTSDAKGNSDFAVARFQGDPSAAGGGLGPAPGTGGTGTGGKGSSAGPPKCAGRRATIFGTKRGEKLIGTKKADVIVGLGGNDVIRGGGGKDLICGGTGNDRIDSGTGNDRVYGQSGKDRLLGASGNDRIDGGTGNDRVYGQSGKDRLLGAGGNDLIDGGTGNDSIYGQSGKDHLLGASGNDRIDGGTGNDRLAGGTGKDRLTGRSGKDRCAGGAGHDKAACESKSSI